MSNQFSVVRLGSNARYNVVDSLNAKVGECYRVFSGFKIHINGIYFDINDEPSRRGGSTCALVKRLKDVPDFVDKTMNKIKLTDAAFSENKAAALASTIDVECFESKGEVLSWLVAKSLRLDFELGMYGVHAPIYGGKTFDPINDPSLVINIMSEYVKTIDNLSFDGLFRVTALKDDREIGVCVGETIALATLRCLVVSELGARVSVPSCLLNQ